MKAKRIEDLEKKKVAEGSKIEKIKLNIEKLMKSNIAKKDSEAF